MFSTVRREVTAASLDQRADAVCLPSLPASYGGHVPNAPWQGYALLFIRAARSKTRSLLDCLHYEHEVGPTFAEQASAEGADLVCVLVPHPRPLPLR